MRKTVLLILTFIPLLTFSQVKSIPINLLFFNESTAIPFTKLLTTPVHPGIQIGTEFNYKEKPHTRLFQTANLCYFYHNYLNQGFALYSEVGFEYRLKTGFSFTGMFGLGYMHTFNNEEEFTFDNGSYLKKTDKGNARLFPSFSLDFGYYLFKDKQNSPKVFIRYQSWAEYPYSPDFIPVMTHINLHLGVKFYVAFNSKNK
jgi:hypothetical protein